MTKQTEYFVLTMRTLNIIGTDPSFNHVTSQLQLKQQLGNDTEVQMTVVTPLPRK